ncbi:MAG TPA: ABC transporter substrate-binding protein, partial [Actinomycetota bacterium]|nr:ABC transporter substrate-binding protein [Actinomycetota bacterium]
MSWKVLAVVASMSLVAAACGGGGSKKAVTGQTGTTAAPGEGTPKAGGNLIIGVTSEVSGMDPSKDRWDTAGSMYAFSVFDPLATYGKDGKVHPYLAQSLDHNADYTQWTIKLRSGVTFSNGDPLTADDVVFDLNAYRKAPLTGPP